MLKSRSTFSFLLLVFLIAWTPAFAQQDPSRKNLESSPLNIEVKGGLVSLDVSEAEIRDVLEEISRKAHIELIVGENVSGKITTRIAGLPIQDALNILCENWSMVFEYDSETDSYRIARVGAFSGGRDASPHALLPGDGQSKAQATEPSFPKTASSVRPTANTSTVAKTLDRRGRPLYKSGELLIRFRKEATVEGIEALHKTLGSSVLEKMDRLRLQRIKLREGLSEQEAIGHYAASPLVELVERHVLRYPTGVPNDTFFDEQWGLNNISATKAWDFTQGSSEIVVAVVDTGVDYLHPDLSENIWVNAAEVNGTKGVDDDGNGHIDDIHGWDFADNDAYPLDINGHGTHVSGIIGAVGNNQQGVAGLCWTIKLMVLKAQRDGYEELEDWAIIQALIYAMDHGARVVNCSFGGEAFSQVEYDAFAELRDAGILVVCAAGNDALDTDIPEQRTYPACHDLDNIISVAANNQDDTLASFSNFGLTSVDIMAPGVGIKSTVPATTLREAYVAVQTVSGTTTYPAIAMVYAGITGTEGITGRAYFCGLGYPQDFPPEVSGNIALIQRGVIYFSEKTTNAQNAGAMAAVIFNNVVDDLDQNGGTLGQPGDWIPSVSLTKADGEAVKALGSPVVTVVNKVGSSSSAYDLMDGTSMATPYVSGIAGLILSKTPQVDCDTVKSAILNSADLVPSTTGKTVTGGRVNALAALCSTNTVPGDLSFDHEVSLADAILSLQIVSGFTPLICSPIYAPEVDVNKDGKIGLEEAIYLFQLISGIER